MLGWVKRLIGDTLLRAGYRIVKVDNLADRTTAALQKIVSSPAPVIIDVGGHEGESVSFFLELWPRAVIHSFEPDPETFARLEARFGTHPQVVLNNYAVSDSSGERTFYRQYASKLNSFHRIDLEGHVMREWGERHGWDSRGGDIRENANRPFNVSTTTLGDYARANDIQNVDLRKIDTQGHEVEVLNGAGDFLEKVSAIHCEIYLWDMYERSLSFHQIESILLPHGMILYALPRIEVDEADSSKISWVEAVYTKAN